MDKTVWSFSGGAARWIGLARAAQVSMMKGNKPDIIIGTSAGSLLAPIVAVSYDKPELMSEAIKFGETLDVTDMFPSVQHKPFTKKGKPTFNAYMRIITGYNHFGIQDIKPLYKKVFKQEHFELLKLSSIKCFAFGVEGRNGSPFNICLNDATSLDDMINMLELSSRISPFVQPSNYGGKLYVDGGFISFNPANQLFNDYKIKELVSVYSTPTFYFIPDNPNWDQNLFTVITQLLKITTHWLGVKDRQLEEYYTQLNNVKYVRIECPAGIIDETYETDDDQLIMFGNKSYEEAIKQWEIVTN
jgi:predicted acylesterase/phospholipase RssA